jgi:hypothetical protein
LLAFDKKLASCLLFGSDVLLLYTDDHCLIGLDHGKAANVFWIGLAKIGLTPAAVLSQARVPVIVYDGKKNLVTTAQFFALWGAVGELSSDPAAGLKIATQIDAGDRPPSTMAAFYARDYRDALTRLA